MRSLWKNRGFTLIHIIGLALGLATCLLLLDYVSFELGFDRFHAQGNRIYRVVNERYQDGQLVQKGTITYPTVGPALAEDFPEIEKYTRIFYTTNTLMRKEQEIKRLDYAFFVDGNFLDIFSFPLIAGGSDSLLQRANEVVLSRRLAEEWLGKSDRSVVGQYVYLNQYEEPFTIVGICEDVPANSLLQFDLLISYPSAIRYFGEGVDNSWQWSDFYHFLLLKPEADPDALEAKLADFSERRFRGQEVSGSEERFFLQPLSEAHLYSGDLEYEIGQTSNGRSIWLLLAIGFFILAIAWINYVNLSSVRAIERAKEIGIRKVSGARRSQIMGQFILEALLVNLISGAVAWQLLLLLRPWLGGALGTATEMTSLGQNFATGPGLVLTTLCLVAAGILLSGAYPAWLLAAQHTTSVIKGEYRQSARGQLMRRGLVVFQFCASIVLITATLTVYRQLHFMRNQDLGVRVDPIVVVNAPTLSAWDSIFIEKTDAFKEALTTLPGLTDAATSSRVPGQGTGRIFNLRRSAQASDSYMASFIETDHDFAATYGLEPLAGRFFRPTDHHQDGRQVRSVVVNEQTRRMLGYQTNEAIVGEPVHFGERDWTIVGVVPDFHQRSLHHAIEPTVFLPFYSNFNQISLRMETDRIEPTLQAVRRVFEDFFPGNAFEFSFLDEQFQRQYEREQRFGQVLLFFTLLAIAIACLGLFGLAAYGAYLRTREIGIRKVLGASAGQIVALLSGDFLRLVLIAGAIALPLAWWTLSRWLESFAYRTDLPWWLGLATLLSALLIAFFTVGYQAWRAARANPADALRTE